MGYSRGRIVVSVLLGVTVLFAGSLAFNAASNQASWPGPLDLVRKNPWVALLLLLPVAVIALWPQAAGAKKIDVETKREQAILPISTFRMPPRNGTFTGREAILITLHEALHLQRPVTVQALHGMGGVGKTQLALEYAYQHLNEYTFVGFIDAERAELIPSQFFMLAISLGIADPVSDQATAAVYKVLAEHPPWLLIFDNAILPQDLQVSLPTGKSSGGHVLVTTRQRG